MADIEKKTKRYATDLTDEEWERIAPFLPSPARRCGKPGVDLREVLNAVGPITSSAMVAAIGAGQVFTKGRDFAAWLGLVPKQMSTGDRTILGKTSKRGNRYLWVAFVQAAWIVLIRPKSWERLGLKPWIEVARNGFITTCLRSRSPTNSPASRGAFWRAVETSRQGGSPPSMLRRTSTPSSFAGSGHSIPIVVLLSLKLRRRVRNVRSRRLALRACSARKPKQTPRKATRPHSHDHDAEDPMNQSSSLTTARFDDGIGAPKWLEALAFVIVANAARKVKVVSMARFE